MNKLRTVLAVAALAPLLAACAPSPEKICEHIVDLTKKELGDKVDAMSDEQIDEIRKGCLENAKKDQEKDRKKYAKRAKCVQKAESLDDLRDCERQEKEAEGK